MGCQKGWYLSPSLMHSGPQKATSMRASPQVLCRGRPNSPLPFWSSSVCSAGSTSGTTWIVNIASDNKAFSFFFPFSFPNFPFSFHGSKHSLQIITMCYLLRHQNITTYDSAIKVFWAITIEYSSLFISLGKPNGSVWIWQKYVAEVLFYLRYWFYC